MIFKSLRQYALPIDRCGACRTAQKPRHSLFLQKRNESCQPTLDQFPRNRDQDGFTGVWGDQRCLCKFFRFFLLALKRNYMKWSVYVSILIWVARSCACKHPAVWPCLHIFTSISEIPHEHILHQKLWILFLEDSLDQSGHVGGHENMETYEKAKLQSGPTLNKHWSTSRCLQCNDAFFTNCLLKAGTNSGPTHVLPQILTRFPTIGTKTAGQVWVECNLVRSKSDKIWLAIVMWVNVIHWLIQCKSLEVWRCKHAVHSSAKCELEHLLVASRKLLWWCKWRR